MRAVDPEPVLGTPKASLLTRYATPRGALSVETLIAVALLLIRPGIVDSLGSLSAGLLVSYTLHLLVSRARKP